MIGAYARLPFLKKDIPKEKIFDENQDKRNFIVGLLTILIIVYSIGLIYNFLT
jgi:hypothetical protein